jgi:hypothetical protein
MCKNCCESMRFSDIIVEIELDAKLGYLKMMRT